MTLAFADDWNRTCHDPVAAAVAAGWAAAEPVLAGLTLDGIMRRAQGGSSNLAGGKGDPGDAHLAALCRLAVHDSLARRTALQAVLPRLVHTARALARRPASAACGELVGDLVALAWEELGCSADRWPSHLSARLATHVERRHVRAMRHQFHEQPVADPATLLESTASGDAVDVDRVDVANLLRTAVARGLLGADAARILHHVAFSGLTDSQIAAARGGTPAAAKKARQRAVAALRAHGETLGVRAG